MISLLAAAAIAPSIHSELLDNGIRIVAIAMPGAQEFSAQTFVRTGSAFETAATSGSTHLLEHLLFADGEADRIAENAGCLLNATTYRETMRLFVSGPNDAWESGVKAVARLFQEPDFSAIPNETRVIGEEAKLLSLNPDRAAYESVFTAVAPSSPWALSPVGDQVGNITPEALKEARGKFLVGANTVAVVAGDLDPQAALKTLRTLYAGLPKGTRVVAPKFPEFTARRVAGEGRVALVAPSPGPSNPTTYLAFELVADALSSPSRLEEHGLAASRFFGPSSAGVAAAIVFRVADGAPGLDARVSQALAAGISQEEFSFGVSRLAARYGSDDPESQSTIVGMGFLLTGERLDFPTAISRLSKSDVDAAAAVWGVGK